MHEIVNRKTGAALLSVLVCSTLVWLLLGRPSSGVDDADIYLVYARNFLNGHGFVYNLGGEQLEGFSSLIWMLICAVFYTVSHVIETPLLLLNLFFGILTIYLCLQRCNQKPAFLVLLCSAPAWFAWCQLSLAESGIWCLLLTASILAVSERNIFQSTWLLPLLVLARPEAILWGCWLIGILFVGLGFDRGWRKGLRALFRPLFTFAITWTTLAIFRGLYFGTILPSSSSTSEIPILQFKVGSGILYGMGYLFSNPAVLLAVAVFIWAGVREVRRKHGFSRVLAVCCCLAPGLALPLMVQHEPLRAFPLYQASWPLLCLVAAWAMPLIYERQHKLVRRFAPVLLLCAGWIGFSFSTSLKHEFSVAQQAREQGSILARMFEDHDALPTVGSSASGGCKYSYPGIVYDLNGLTLKSKYQTEMFLPFNRSITPEQYPDILVRSGSDTADTEIFQELQAKAPFQRRYVKGELWYNDEILTAYFSRRFLAELEEGHYAFVPDLQYALSTEDFEKRRTYTAEALASGYDRESEEARTF